MLFELIEAAFSPDQYYSNRLILLVNMCFSRIPIFERSTEVFNENLYYIRFDRFTTTIYPAGSVSAINV